MPSWGFEVANSSCYSFDEGSSSAGVDHNSSCGLGGANSASRVCLVRKSALMTTLAHSGIVGRKLSPVDSFEL
jgi:hypothetical protein